MNIRLYASEMSKKHNYVYLDDSNIEQGPFTELEMKEWFEAGYFKDDLLVKNLTKKAPFITIVEKKNSGKPYRFTLKNIPETEPESEVDEEKFYYIDQNRVVQGPFSEFVMTEWFVAGYFKPDVLMSHCKTSGFRSLADLRKNPDFPLQDSAISWIYLDSNEQEQGPFWNDDMMEWWNEGSLPPTLLVKKKGEISYLAIQDRLDCEFVKSKPAVVVKEQVQEPVEAPKQFITSLSNPIGGIPPPPKPAFLSKLNNSTNSNTTTAPAPVATITSVNSDAQAKLQAFLAADRVWMFHGPDGNELGPFTSIQLNQMLVAGTLTVKSLVRKQSEVTHTFLNTRMPEIQVAIANTQANASQDYTTVAAFNMKSGKYQKVRNEPSPFDRFFNFDKWQEEKNEASKRKKSKLK